MSFILLNYIVRAANVDLHWDIVVNTSLSVGKLQMLRFVFLYSCLLMIVR